MEEFIVNIVKIAFSKANNKNEKALQELCRFILLFISLFELGTISLILWAIL